MLLGAVLRVGMLAQQGRFDSDEALYATFARRISLHGDLLLADAPLDKPPLALFITALSFSVLGPTEFAARLPTLFASLLTLAALYALAQRVYRRRHWLLPLLTMLLLALSPFDLAFAATAYLDPLMTLWLVLACLAASRDRWGYAGLAFGLAAATKQTALPFVAFIVAIGLAANAGLGWRWQGLWSRVWRFVLPLIMVGVLLALWSAARNAPVEFWALGAANNNPGRLIRANEILPRLVRWGHLLAAIVGFAPQFLLAGVAVAEWPGKANRNRAMVANRLILALTLLFVAGYWLVAFNTYDRYLHPLAPFALMLVAYGAWYLAEHLRWRSWWLAGVIICMLPFTATALRGQLDIGGDRGQHAGLESLVRTLRALPPGATVYDYWLGWELGFYLGDSPAVRIVFEPSPEALARAVCQHRAESEASYLAAPTEEAAGWLPLLRTQKVSAVPTPDTASGRFALYRLSCV